MCRERSLPQCSILTDIRAHLEPAPRFSWPCAPHSNPACPSSSMNEHSALLLQGQGACVLLLHDTACSCKGPPSLQAALYSCCACTQVRTYEVVPVSASLGLVQFVPGTQPLKAAIAAFLDPKARILHYLSHSQSALQ